MKTFFIKVWNAIDLKNYWQLYFMTILVVLILLMLLGVVSLPALIDSFAKGESALSG